MKTKKINFDYKYGFSVKSKNVFTAEELMIRESLDQEEFEAIVGPKTV